MQESLESLVNVLESYRGRDKVIRTLCYGSQLVGGVLSQKTERSAQLSQSLLLFSAQLSHCRTVLRLFDDLSMLAYSHSYGLGAGTEDSGLRWVSVLTNVADQLYYPCEHVAWAVDAQIIRVDGGSGRWWRLSTALWGASLLLGILRSIRVLMLLRRKLRKQEESRQAGSSVGGAPSEGRAPGRAQLRRQMGGEVLSVLSSLADLSNAVHWLPPGFLWAGRLPVWLVGLLGTTSSLVGLVQMSSSQAAST